MCVDKRKVTRIDVVSEINLTLKVHRVRVVVVAIKSENLHIFIITQMKQKRNFSK